MTIVDADGNQNMKYTDGTPDKPSELDPATALYNPNWTVESAPQASNVWDILGLLFTMNFGDFLAFLFTDNNWLSLFIPI